MRLIHLVLLAALSVSGAVKAQTENDLTFDAIMGLENVKSVAFDTEVDTIFVTLPDRTLHMDLYPLRLKGEAIHEFSATSNGVDPDGDLFVVGEEERADLKGLVFSRGSVSSYQNVRSESLTMAREPIPFDIAPLSGITFDRKGLAYIQSLTHHSVIQHEKGTFNFKDILLDCGPTSKFSVLETGDAVNFVSTVGTDDVIELGSVSNKSPGICIDGDRLSPQVTRSLSKKSQSASVKHHSLIVPRSVEETNKITGSGVLLFDSVNKHLTFFPLTEFGGDISLRRSAQVSFDMTNAFGNSSGNFGRMAADKTGETILLAAFDEQKVHRLTWNGEGFDYLGAFEMGASIKSVYISDDGEFAAVVTGNPNGYSRKNPENEIILIRLPSSLPKDARMGVQRHSVEKLQQELKNAGDENVLVDGILGPETLFSIANYWSKSEAERTSGVDALVQGIMPNWVDQMSAN